jgi:hypothetical protein
MFETAFAILLFVLTPAVTTGDEFLSEMNQSNREILSSKRFSHNRQNYRAQGHHQNTHKRAVTNSYSSFRCLGGSQYFETESMRQATFKKFPLNDPEHRVCLFTNICIQNGSFTYYQRPTTLPIEFSPEGFSGKMFHTGHQWKSPKTPPHCDSSSHSSTRSPPPPAPSSFPSDS